jgi:prepilin-type N-terminal cleavage/methylation domain-containing protein
MRSSASRHRARGFTLIELLVVIAIISILAAIAIPQFAAYRATGFNARVASDARTAATANEAYFIDNSAYATSGNCSLLPSMVISAGVTCTLGSATCSDGTSGFTVATSHPRAKKSCTWNSCGQTCIDSSTGNLCCA